MADDFDPYHKWLGIPKDSRPPTHYQLLGISPDEKDPAVIDASVIRQSAFVRDFQTGKHAEQATKLHNEIALAQVCLKDQAKRAQYDATLKKQPPPRPSSPASLASGGPSATTAPSIASAVPPRKSSPVAPPTSFAIRPPPPRLPGAMPSGRSHPRTRQKWKPSALIWLASLVALAGAALIALYAVSSHLGGDGRLAGPMDSPAIESTSGSAPGAKWKPTEPGDADRASAPPRPSVSPPKPPDMPPRELTIVDATYGAGDKQLDVTEHVRAAMRNGRLVGTVSSEIVGRQDPAPGLTQALTIHYRLGNEVLSVGADDGQFIYIAVPGAANAPSNAGGLELIEARYGAGLTWVDVLPRLRTSLHGDQLDVRAELLSRTDPAPGTRKVLYARYVADGIERLAYAYDGRELVIDVRRLRAAGQTVDLLKLIDVERDAVWGEWQLNATGLVSPDKTPYARLQVPFGVPEEYAVTMTAEPEGILNNEQVLRIGLVGGGSQFQLALQHRTKSGLSVLDNDGWGRGEATFPGFELKPGVQNTIVCTVRKTGVDIAVDGSRVMEWRGSFRHLSLNAELRVPDPRRLFVGADGAYKISQLELTPLVADKPASAHIANAAGPLDLLKLIDPVRDAVKGSWRFDGQELVAPDDPVAVLQLPHNPPEEFILSMRVRRISGNNTFAIGIPVGTKQVLVALDAHASTVSGLEYLDSRFVQENESTRRGTLFVPNKEVTITVTVRKDRITCTFDDVKVLDWRGDPQRLSLPETFAVPDRKAFFMATVGSSYAISGIVLAPVRIGD